MNILKFAKMARAGSLEQIQEVLSGMGMEIELQPIPLEKRPAVEELDAVACAALREGSRFFRLTAKMQTGQTLNAFVVLGEPKVIQGKAVPIREETQLMQSSFIKSS